MGTTWRAGRTKRDTGGIRSERKKGPVKESTRVDGDGPTRDRWLNRWKTVRKFGVEFKVRESLRKEFESWILTRGLHWRLVWDMKRKYSVKHERINNHTNKQITIENVDWCPRSSCVSLIMSHTQGVCDNLSIYVQITHLPFTDITSPLVLGIVTLVDLTRICSWDDILLETLQA